MVDNQSDSSIKQLDRVLTLYKELQAKYRPLSDAPSSAVQKIISMSRAAIERIGGTSSPYAGQAMDILSRSAWDSYKAEDLVGVVEALRADLEAGYLQSVEELIHGELFSDFLEMADHLLEEGYKDASAVIAGSSLEGHLRQLCKKHGIDTERTTSVGVRPKKADLMNSELAKAIAYSKLDQKNVTAWLDLRNKAAHGEYGEYTVQQVALMIAGIRDFFTRNPA